MIHILIVWSSRSLSAAELLTFSYIGSQGQGRHHCACFICWCWILRLDACQQISGFERQFCDSGDIKVGGVGGIRLIICTSIACICVKHGSPSLEACELQQLTVHKHRVVEMKDGSACVRVIERMSACTVVQICDLCPCYCGFQHVQRLFPLAHQLLVNA